ncbi:HAD hydrolase-like protein [Duganella sp. FT92W]|uniref:HAD hydrolase-like protein n=2 Tax=Pseudoduganella rivuli TaxID=2666085 RepID=A0A7X2IM84_9BURK|nr:HAD hydrolase-like protein [Pseudoduganella rivuli]
MRKRAMTINAILLNLDEILFDTAPLHLAAIHAAMEGTGVPLRWSMPELREVASTVGWTRVLDVALPQEEKNEKGGKRSRAIDLNAAHHRHFHDALATRKPEANPRGVQLIKDALDAGCKLGVISDLPAPSAAALLEQLFGNDVNSKFTLVASRHDAGHRHHDGMHALALRTMGVHADETVLIDTSLPNLLAARKSGLRTVHFKMPGILSWKSLPAMASRAS